MEKVSIDYGFDGDIELIIENKNILFNHAAQEFSQSIKQEELTKYDIGPLSGLVREFHLRVSSAKLISSSNYFRTILESSSFCEACELKENGQLRIRLSDPEDDPTAIMIILGILYEIDVKVNTTVDLATLYKVAVVADKYQWQALVTSHVILWFNRLLIIWTKPYIIDENFFRMLFIAWLFGMKDLFKMISRFAQVNAMNSIDLKDESILIPTKVLEAINKQRKVAFQKIEQKLEAFKSRILDPNIEPHLQRPEQQIMKYMAFGFATFCSRDLRLGEFATPDHAGSSIASLISNIEHLQSIQDFKFAPLSWSRYFIPSEIFDLRITLQAAISDLRMEEWGLAYDDFNISIVVTENADF